MDIALDTIQDPGNLGTIIRSADWFGIRHIVCNEGCADYFSPKVVQASMGAILRVKVYYEDLAVICEKICFRSFTSCLRHLHGRYACL